ncbi:hypothetical protein ACWIUH_11250 [Ursidibacter arcticus]
MKQQFITNLKNGKISAAQNRTELAELVTQGGIFSPLAEHIKADLKDEHYWGSSEYFFSKANLLANNFSQELCEHLIQVKEHLQQISAQGFTVENVTETVNTTTNFTQETPKANQYVEPDLSRYVPNSKLKGYLDAQDISAIRAFLSAELSDFRLTIEELIQAVFYVEKNAKGVFEEYKTSAFIAEIEQDESKWNGRYFDKQQGDLNQNFALVRFFHLVNVRETLMRKGDPDFQQIKVERKKPQAQTQAQAGSQRTASPSTQRSHTGQSTRQTKEQSTNSSNSKVLAAILAVGGLVALALWKIFH